MRRILRPGRSRVRRSGSELQVLDRIQIETLYPDRTTVCSRKLKIVRKKLKKTVYIRTWRLVCKVLIRFLLSILVLFRIFVSYCLYSYSSGYSFLTVYTRTVQDIRFLLSTYTRTLQDICFLSNFSLSVSDWVLDKIRIPVSKMLGTDLDPSYNNLDPKTCFCHVVPVYCIVTILIMFWNGTKPVQ